MTYSEWLENVPEIIKQDVLWKVEAYRLGLFMSDLAWHDVGSIRDDPRTRSLIDQLYRAVGSVSANIAEGFSRQSPKEKARFYEYALGSARESRDWYYKIRHVLAGTVFEHRIDVLTQVIRLLITMVPDQRQRMLRDETMSYASDHESTRPFNPNESR